MRTAKLFFFNNRNKTNLYLSIRTINNIYNFKLYRIVYKLKTKYMSTIEKLFTVVNNLKVGKGKLSITKKIKNL